MNKELFDERKKLFHDAMRLQHTERTPMYANIMTWKILDEGYTLPDAVFDLDTYEKIIRAHMDRYQFDMYNDFGSTGILGVSKALGVSNFTISESGEEYSLKDHHCMEADEYDVLTEDFKKYNWTYAFRRHCKGELSMETFKKAVQVFLEFGGFTQKMYEMAVQEYSCPLTPDFMYSVPIENFILYYRGMKETSIDMRRKPEQLKAALDAMFEGTDVTNIPMGEFDGMDLYTSSLAHTFMNPKQFEKFYWPYMKPFYEHAEKNDYSVLAYIEGTCMPFKDHFNDLSCPIGVQAEVEDVFTIRQAMPKVCVFGGLEVSKLYNSTPEECVDFTKQLIDDFGDGLVLTSYKALTYKNDCARENLLAVNNFVREYKH